MPDYSPSSDRSDAAMAGVQAGDTPRFCSVGRSGESVRTRLTIVGGFLLASSLTLAACGTTPIAAPEQPDNLWEQARIVHPGDPWLVGIGDSFMSGEGGRWASNGLSNTTIASNGGWLLGSNDQVYGDAPDGRESIPYCHRSATAPMFVGPGWNSKNLACSGAMTTTFVSERGNAKPGIDFASQITKDGHHFVGQAAMLRDFARTHDVQAVTMSIGGNDLGFADIISNCLQDWAVNTECRNSGFVTSRLNPGAKQALTERVAVAIANVNTAMTQAGYSPDRWRLLIQLPPSPVPPAALAAYPDHGFDRQVMGGCGILDADLDWANSTLLPYLDSAISAAVRQSRKQPARAPVTTLDTRDSLVGHRLCEQGTSRPDAGTGIPPDGFGQDVEWIRFISVLAAEGYPDSPDSQEAMHPTFFGQRTLASCTRAALATPVSTKDVSCTRNAVLEFNEYGLPAVSVQPPK